VELRAGFIGCGRIGTPMAARALGAGFALAIHDARPEALRGLGARGARVCSSAAEVARFAPVVCVVVLDDAQTREVVAGPEGLLAGAVPGSAICICSTVREATVHELAALAAELGVDLLDAGVAGGVTGAETGTLIATIGGDRGAFERVRPLLASFAKDLIYAGQSGAGMRLKLVKNLISYLALAAGHEGRLLAEAAGFDLATLRRVVDGSSLVHQFFDFALERPPRRLAQASDSAAEIEHALAYAAVARKDLQAALEFAREVGVELPLGERALAAVGSYFRVPRELEVAGGER
jgi:3-hydroxyisobutyrate dehydrogenase-like beta-hydroxyacid dehydrogenase